MGVQPDQWAAFLDLATEAAEIWPIPHLRNGIVTALGAVKAEICTGVLDDAKAVSPRSKDEPLVQEIGFDRFLSSAALDKCGGDAPRALELLARGWVPDDQVATADAVTALPKNHRLVPVLAPAPNLDERLANAAKARVGASGLDELCFPVSLLLGWSLPTALQGF